MATVTSTATGKKKLVYKQDPDGVFRLKKLPSDASSTLSRGSEDVRLEKRAVDSYINELIECSYQVPALAPKPALTPVPEKIVDEASKLPDSDDKQPSRGKKSRKAKTPSISSEATLDLEPELFVPERSLLPQTAEPTPFPDLPSSDSEEPPMPSAPKSRFAWDPITLPADPRIVSYVLGLATAGLLLRFWPSVSSYAVVALNVLKMGVLWGTVVAVIAWYAGLINVHNLLVVFLKGLVDRLRAKALGQAPDAPQKTSPVAEHSAPKTVHMAPSPMLELPDSSSEEEEDEDLVGIPEEPRRARSASPQKERRNTLTKVTPYKPAPKPDRYHSAQDVRRHTPKLNRIQTADARLFQRRLAPLAASSRKNSTHSLDMAHLRHDPSELTSRLLPNKRLPPHPYETEELPFINEVKLMTKAEMDDDSIVDVHRLGSVFSKKSVLGTRAGYNKFLENFGED